MTQLDDVIVGAVALAGGRIVGRIRLQKIIYLLEQKGLRSGVAFAYHHYGPYAEAVTDAITDAKFWGNLEEKIELRQSDGAPFSVFETSSSNAPVQLGALDGSVAAALIRKLVPVNSTVLELAATIHWLAYVERVSDWQGEISRRKPGKTGSGRLERAVSLLEELDLAPAHR